MKNKVKQFLLKNGVQSRYSGNTKTLFVDVNNIDIIHEMLDAEFGRLPFAIKKSKS